MAFDKYAKYYDIFYLDKDYKEECDFLEEIFRRFNTKPEKILDVACGTGGHAIPLAVRGYKVVGADASATMIEIAKKKAVGLGANLSFKVEKMQSLDLKEKFDAAIAMFAAIDYLTSAEELLSALKAINSHLYEGSLFVFDFWYGPAVLKIKPSIRKKLIEDGGKRILRIVTPELDVNNHINKCHYWCLVIKNDKILDEFEETHEVRYFFSLEIKHYLDDAGFELLKLCPFMEFNAEPSDATWNVTAIAKKKREVLR